MRAAAGAWSGEIGRTAAVDLPILPIRRQIAVTTPLPGVEIVPVKVGESDRALAPGPLQETIHTKSLITLRGGIVKVIGRK